MEKEEVQGPEEEEDPKVQKLRSNSVWKKKKDDFEEYSALPSSSSLKIGEKTSERTDQNQALYREESLDLNAKRVRIRKNGQFSGGKWMHIQETESFNSFLQRVSTKLGIQAKCVFDGDGTEFEDIQSMRDGETLYVSEGAPFVKVPKEEMKVLEHGKKLNRTVSVAQNLKSYSQLTKTDYSTTINKMVNEVHYFLNLDEGWSSPTQRYDVIMDYRKKDNNTYVFRGIGEIRVPPKTLFELVSNPENSLQWEHLIKNVNIVEEVGENILIVHRMYQARFCITKVARDFCSLQYHHFDENDGTCLIIIRSIEHPLCPPNKKYKRTKVEPSGFVVKPKVGNPNSSIVSFITQVDTTGFPSALLKFLIDRQPLGIAGIRKVLTGSKKNKLAKVIRNSQREDDSMESSNASNTPNQTPRLSTQSPTDWTLEFSEVILETIVGKGQYGDVYKGKWRGIDVAVKKLRTELTDDAELQQEAELMIHIKNHVNVVTFYGIIFDPLCIITEYCSGGSLLNLLMSEEVINRPIIIKIIKGIINGMNHIHKQSIVHRDLAARNILLNDQKIPKIADFGLSRAINQPEESTATTESPTGPIRHMSPESLRDRKYSIKSDSWSFGVVLYEIIARQVPYQGLTITQVATRVCTGELTLELSSQQAANWPQIVYLMKWTMNFDPFKRPTFQEIQQYIDSSLND